MTTDQVLSTLQSLWPLILPIVLYLIRQWFGETTSARAERMVSIINEAAKVGVYYTEYTLKLTGASNEELRNEAVKQAAIYLKALGIEVTPTMLESLVAAVETMYRQTKVYFFERHAEEEDPE